MIQVSTYAIPNIASGIKENIRSQSTQNIIDTTLQQLHLSWKQVNQKTRKTEIVQARQIIMYLCHSHIKMTLNSIAALFTHQYDHTTVLHAKKHIQNLIDTEPQFKQLIQTIAKNL